MEDHDESEAKEEAFTQILPAFQKELIDVYMSSNTPPYTDQKMPTSDVTIGTGGAGGRRVNMG